MSIYFQGLIYKLGTFLFILTYQSALRARELIPLLCKEGLGEVDLFVIASEAKQSQEHHAVILTLSEQSESKGKNPV